MIEFIDPFIHTHECHIEWNEWLNDGKKMKSFRLARHKNKLIVLFQKSIAQKKMITIWKEGIVFIKYNGMSSCVHFYTNEMELFHSRCIQSRNISRWTENFLKFNFLWAMKMSSLQFWWHFCLPCFFDGENVRLKINSTRCRSITEW